MKIQLSQDEIEQAVRDYVSKGITLANGNQMTVDFSMGRGDNGLSATIDIPYMGVASLPVQPTAAAPAPVPSSLPVTPVAKVKVQATEPADAEVPAAAAEAKAFVPFGATSPSDEPAGNVEEVVSTKPAGASLFSNATP